MNRPILILPRKRAKSVTLSVRGSPLNVYYVDGRVKLVGDFLDITEKLTADEVQRIKDASTRKNGL